MVVAVTPAATAGRCGSSTGDCAFGDRRSVTGGTRGLSTTLGAAERAAGVFEIASATPEGFCSGRGLSATEAEAPERFSPVVTPETLRGIAAWPLSVALLVISTISMFAVTACFGWAYQTLLPALAHERFGRGAAGVGALMAAAGVGSVFAALVTAAMSQTPQRRYLIYGGAFSYSGALALFAGSRGFPTALALAAVVGFGLIVCGVNVNAQLQESVPDELRYVPVFFQLGIRMMHLTYQRRNMLGDGCGPTPGSATSAARPLPS